MDSWFDLVGSRQHGVASNEVICWLADHPLNALQMAMTSHETQSRIWQIFTDWPTSNAKRETKSNKNQEYHDVVAIKRLLTDKTVPQKNHGQTMLKMSSIPDLKRPTAPKILISLITIMQRTTNKNAAGLHRISKRFDQPKIETLKP